MSTMKQALQTAAAPTPASIRSPSSWRSTPPFGACCPPWWAWPRSSSGAPAASCPCPVAYRAWFEAVGRWRAGPGAVRAWSRGGAARCALRSRATSPKTGSISEEMHDFSWVLHGCSQDFAAVALCGADFCVKAASWGM